jgi:lycopene cyclase domain-containing protein
VLPDIGVLGPYTYLATELMWGVVAAGLLHYSGAWRAALRTALVLYPFALAWDWYTLEVGVFEIPLRTGVELLGVPIEEHVFMFLVPAMVVGTHETLRKLGTTESDPTDPAGRPGRPDPPPGGDPRSGGTGETDRGSAPRDDEPGSGAGPERDH